MKKMRKSFLALIAVSVLGFIAVNCGDSSSSDTATATATVAATVAATATTAGSSGSTITITDAVWQAEAESATLSSDCTVETAVAGFSGTGYVRFAASASPASSMTFTIPTSQIANFSTAANAYTLGVRFISSSTSKGSCMMYINTATTAITLGGKAKGLSDGTDYSSTWAANSTGERTLGASAAFEADASGNISIKITGKGDSGDNLYAIDLVYLKKN